MTNTGEKKRDYKREYAKRKERQKRIHTDMDRNKVEAFTNYLKAKDITFAAWLNNQIDVELSRDKAK